MDEFYVGYLPYAPAATAKRIRRTAIALMFLAAALACVFVRSQAPFPDRTFDYDHVQSLAGTLVLDDVPHLLTPNGSLVLVGQGKHGANLPIGDNGHAAIIQGKEITHGDMRLIEVVDEKQSTSGVTPSSGAQHFGPVTLNGEIVDSKCYAGVMNPGHGKVHRSCAARCLHGGIPAALLSDDRIYYLTGMDPAEFSAHAGEPVTISGRLEHKEGLAVIRVERLVSH